MSTAERSDTTSEPKQERRDVCEHAGSPATLGGRGESVDFLDAFGVLVVTGQATNSFWFLGIVHGIMEPAAGGVLLGTIR
jgi:hypothetical protein